MVEDQKLSRNLELAILSKSKILTQSADDSELALILYGRHQSTLKIVLLDLNLPNIGGDQVCKAIRRFEARALPASKVKIFGLTAGALLSDAQMRSVGMNGCWQKGCCIEQLVKAELSN